MLLLKSFRKNIKGVADILKYGALIEPSVIFCKDGSFLTMYEFRGKDTASSPNSELNYVALQMNNALKTFGDGWALHVDAMRTASTYYPDNNHFPEGGVAKLIDEERRAFFKDATCYQTRQYLTVTYLPGYAADKMAAKASGQKMQDEVERGLKAFKLGLAGFEDIAVSAIRLRRLGEYQSAPDIFCHEMLEVIHHLITGIKQGITLPDCPMYLDAILPSQDVEGGATPKVGENYISVISIDGFPQASWPAMLKILDQLPFEYRFHTRWLALSKESAAKEIKMMQKGWNQKVYSAFAQLFNVQRARPNTDALRMVDDAQGAADVLMSDYVSFGYLTSSIIILDNRLDLLEEAARLVRKSIQGLNFTCRIETLNTMDAWIGSHPGNTYANIRRPLLSSMNLAHLLPLASTWHGEIHNPCPLYPAKSPCLAVVVTDGNTPFYFSPHVVDVGHMLICGTTGTGKSTLLNFLAGQFPRYPGARIFCFDKSRSMKILCDAEGGRHFDLGVNRQISFAPLVDIDQEARRAWALEWLEDLINMQNERQVSAKQQNVIAESLMELSLQPAEFRTLTQMHILFSAKDEFLADSIKNYTLQGTEGHLLDASLGSIELSRFTVFEIEELMDRGDRTLVPTLQYLFSVIERSLTGAPSLLILDEAWIMFGHPVFRAKIREWLKMLRKANCSLVLATQQLTDAVNSGIFDILIDSCQTKVWLPNREAKDNEMQREIYTKAGLNSREIETLSEATPKRDYYVKSPEGSRLVNLNLQEKALAFFSHNSKEALAEVDRLQAAHPDTWRELWLERCKSLKEQAA